jgi:WD40 repeat protein
VKDGALLHTLTGHATTVTDVKFSPDGQFLASASWDNTIKIWNLDGTIWRTLNETSRVTRIAFNPDGKLIASVNDSSAINLWHLDGILLKSLRGHSTTVRDIAFSPNGQQIASASDDQSVILWNLSRILPMDLLTYGCSWIQDYLRTHLEVKESMPPDSNVLKSILPNVYTSRRLCNNLSAPFTDRQ